MENGKKPSRAAGSAELDQKLLLETSEECEAEVCRQLLDQGANVNARDEDGCSPLLWAVLAGNKEVVKMLLAQGAEVNVSNLDGGAPLHWAAVTGKIEIAQLLLDKGAKVNAKDVFGITPLRSASLNGDWNMVKRQRRPQPRRR